MESTSISTPRNKRDLGGPYPRDVLLERPLHVVAERELNPKLRMELLTPWFMEPSGSMPHSQGISNNPYPEPNQPNSPH